MRCISKVRKGKIAGQISGRKTLPRKEGKEGKRTGFLELKSTIWYKPYKEERKKKRKNKKKHGALVLGAKASEKKF